MSTGESQTQGLGAPETTPAQAPASNDGPRRVCLLTGSAGKLGSAFCALYGDRYDIVAVYRRNRPWFASQDAGFIDPLAPGQPMEENRNRIFAIRADLSQPGECERVVDVALSRFGRIDLLVNAAVDGGWAPMLGSDTLLRSGGALFATNVLIPLRLSTVVARRFWQSRDDENRWMGRNIVNVSSVAGLRMYVGSGQSLYAASKAAMNSLTGHMAEEFRSVGVRVNATAPNSFPGHTAVERVAASIVTLDQTPVNGTILVVDGDYEESIQMVPFNAPRPVPG